MDALLEIERSNNGENLNFMVYRQQAGADTFYRVLVPSGGTADFMSRGIMFENILVYRNAVLFLTAYAKTVATQNGDVGSYMSLDIIPGTDRARGILLTTLAGANVRYDIADNPAEWSSTFPQRNGRMYGGTLSNYYLMDDLINGSNSSIEIYAPDCLVDPDVPLRYSLQNAFDGDPATSYVENDDSVEYDNVEYMMNITFNTFNHPTVSRLAIINGFASEPETYKNYSRVKNIANVHGDLIDGELTYQFLSGNVALNFWVTEVYEGVKYGNLAVSELNFLTDDGWFFGDIDGQ